jgi:hypothetical protein
VGALPVILISPAGDLAPRVEQLPEPTDVQTLLSQAPIEIFGMRVLRRLPRLDVHEIDPPLGALSKEVSRGYLRPVVTGSCHRRSTLLNNSL